MPVDLMSRADIEREVSAYIATPSRQFAALRASASVDVALLRRGALEHPNPKLRWQCIILLDHLDGDDSVPVFLQIVRHDPVPRVRRHALHALTCVPCKERPLAVDVAPVLAETAAADPNPKLRRLASEALACRMLA